MYFTDSLYEIESERCLLSLKKGKSDYKSRLFIWYYYPDYNGKWVACSVWKVSSKKNFNNPYFEMTPEAEKEMRRAIDLLEFV